MTRAQTWLLWCASHVNPCQWQIISGKEPALSYSSAPFFTSALTLRLLRYGSRCLRYQLNVRILVGTSRKEFCLVGLIHEHIDDPSIGCMDSANLLCALDTQVITFLKVGAFSISLHCSLYLSHHINGCAYPCSPMVATSYEFPARLCVGPCLYLLQLGLPLHRYV